MADVDPEQDGRDELVEESHSGPDYVDAPGPLNWTCLATVPSGVRARRAGGIDGGTFSLTTPGCWHFGAHGPSDFRPELRDPHLPLCPTFLLPFLSAVFVKSQRGLDNSSVLFQIFFRRCSQTGDRDTRFRDRLGVGLASVDLLLDCRLRLLVSSDTSQKPLGLSLRRQMGGGDSSRTPATQLSGKVPRGCTRRSKGSVWSTPWNDVVLGRHLVGFCKDNHAYSTTCLSSVNSLFSLWTTRV
ncbi:hypothetical protein DFH06DRAFT_1128094 [Mycena polygramma]|nr:hypothetical protein DFH06DRAFT_1128094 [Mycena polygramma]